MKKRNKEEIYIEEKDYDGLMSAAHCAVGFSTLTSAYLSVITGCIDKLETLPYFIIGGVLMTPVYYYAVKKVREKQDAEYKKTIEEASRILAMAETSLENETKTKKPAEPTEETKKTTATPDTDFDITSSSDLNLVITIASQHEPYKEFGNPEDIVWDMEFLNKILSVIAINYNQELNGYHQDYSDLDLATSFITNTITHALVNNIKEVGQREMLSVFKSWNYIPSEIQSKVLKELSIEEEQEYIGHKQETKTFGKKIFRNKITIGE